MKINKKHVKHYKNRLNNKNKMINCAYFIKNHFKLYALEIIKRYVLNALSLDSIKDMNSKAFNKCKIKKTNAISKFFKFLNKNRKFNSECVVNKLNLD